MNEDMDQVDEGIFEAASITHFVAQFGMKEEWIVRWSCADGVAHEAVFTDKAEALSLLARMGYTA